MKDYLSRSKGQLAASNKVETIPSNLTLKAALVNFKTDYRKTIKF